MADMLVCDGTCNGIPTPVLTFEIVLYLYSHSFRYIFLAKWKQNAIKIKDTPEKVRRRSGENVSSGICGQRRPRSACSSAQSDQGLRCLLTESSGTIECIDGEQMPGWDIAHARDESEYVHFAHVRRHIRQRDTTFVHSAKRHYFCRVEVASLVLETFRKLGFS